MAYRDFMGPLEEELIGAHGIEDSEAPRYHGRGLGWAFKRLPGLPKGKGPYPVASEEAPAWRRVANWLRELGHVVVKPSVSRVQPVDSCLLTKITIGPVQL
eukprot:257959-Pyramimonas_sp.AAC.1